MASHGPSTSRNRTQALALHRTPGQVISILMFLLVGILVPLLCQAQIDPYRRQLLQFGYNQPVEGHWPLAGYLFYLLNQPDFLRPNLTLRLAVAPTYVDSEVGFTHAIGPQTDLALGLSGGGFADSYYEIRRGQYLAAESFLGNGGGASVSLYHRFNPNQRLPLSAVIRGIIDYSSYERDDDTADTFVLPDDRFTYIGRAGLRCYRRSAWSCPPGMKAASGADMARMGLTATAW
jgi:hypothetical protein